jgi:hypothetical protein
MGGCSLLQADAKRIAGADESSHSGSRPSATTNSRSAPSSSEQPAPSGAEVAEVARCAPAALLWGSRVAAYAYARLPSRLDKREGRRRGFVFCGSYARGALTEHCE